MADVKAGWSKSPTADVTSYNLHWFLNGAAVGSVVAIPQDSTSDTNGYSRLFSQDNPSVAPAPGNQFSFTVTATGPTGTSSPAVSSNVTVPTAQPPLPPQNPTIALV